jgi:tripartite-type tricarboxylate transporter receptor subunit TctC
MNRRRLLLALCAGALPSLPAPAAAQPFPNRPIKIIVSFPAGGPIDVMARLIGQQLSMSFGQVVIENRPGGSGTLGLKGLVSAPPDGYTLLISGPMQLSVVPTLSKTLDIDPARSIAPVALVSSVPFVLVVAPHVSAKSVPELIAYAKANPGKLNFGTPSGALPHLVGELFKMKTGINFVTIPYRGAATTVTDMLTGQIDMAFEPTSVTLTHIHDAKIRPLAITSAKRSPLLPAIPTIQESGLPGFEAVSWTGLVTTGGTPPEIIATLNRAVTDAVRSPEMTQALGRLGGEGLTGTPEEFATLLMRDSAKWIEVIKTAGIKIE